MYMKVNLNHLEWSLQNSSICALEILASFPENFDHQLPFLKLKYSLWVYPQHKLSSNLCLPGKSSWRHPFPSHSKCVFSYQTVVLPQPSFSPPSYNEMSQQIFVSLTRVLTWQFQPSLSRGNFKTPMPQSGLAPGTFLGNTVRQMLNIILETGSYI